MASCFYFSSFELTPKVALNARSQGERRRGVLLRNREGGVACLQPWPELGEASLAQEMAALQAGEPLALGKRALACMREDAAARALGRSLFEGLSVPPSHLSATLPLLRESSWDFFVQKGFQALKLKVSSLNPAWGRELQALLAESNGDWRLRLDLNAAWRAGEVREFWATLPQSLRERVDFVEDPCPYCPETWQELSLLMPLAFDWEGKAQLLGEGSPFMPICKPASEDPALFTRQRERVVFTSSMDHPMGQAWAAYEAARSATRWQKPLPLCGLVTEHLYQTNAFSEALGDFSPVFKSGEGTGLGFDAILEGLSWQRIEKFS